MAKMQYWKCVSVIISRGLNEYHSLPAQKLCDPSVRSKTCWPILKRLFNGKKVSIITHPY